MCIYKKIISIILIISLTSCYSVSSIEKDEFENNIEDYNLYSLETSEDNYSLDNDNVSFVIIKNGIKVETKTIKTRIIPVSSIAEFLKKEKQLTGIKTIKSEFFYASDSLSFDTNRSGIILKATSTESKVILFEEITNYEYEYLNIISTAFASIGIFFLASLISFGIAMGGVSYGG